MAGSLCAAIQSHERVVCVDEKSKQLLKQTRTPIQRKPGHCAKEDYEYERAGTCNIFVAGEPKGGQRHVEATPQPRTPHFCRVRLPG